MNGTSLNTLAKQIGTFFYATPNKNPEDLSRDEQVLCLLVGIYNELVSMRKEAQKPSYMDMKTENIDRFEHCQILDEKIAKWFEIQEKERGPCPDRLRRHIKNLLWKYFGFRPGNAFHASLLKDVPYWPLGEYPISRNYMCGPKSVTRRLYKEWLKSKAKNEKQMSSRKSLRKLT